MSKTPLVKVTWLDAITWCEQLTFEEAIAKCEPAVRSTVGWMIHKDTNQILLAHTLDIEKDGTITAGADFTSLPRHWATDIIELED